MVAGRSTSQRAAVDRGAPEAKLSGDLKLPALPSFHARLDPFQDFGSYESDPTLAERDLRRELAAAPKFVDGRAAQRSKRANIVDADQDLVVIVGMLHIVISVLMTTK